MSEINVLEDAIGGLKIELEKFRSTKQLLNAEREKTNASLNQWKEQQAVDSSQRVELIEAVKRVNASNAKLVAQIDPLADKLLLVAKAVDSAGFPNRLDSLQANTANAVLTIQSIQSRLDLMEVNQGNAIKLAVNDIKGEIKSQLDLLEVNQEEKIKQAVDALKDEMAWSKQEILKRLITFLLVTLFVMYVLILITVK